MRKTLGGVVATLALLFATEAHAQFANRSLGFGVSFAKFFGGALSMNQVPIDFAAPIITLEGSFYLENGFDLYVKPMFLIVQVGSGAPTPNGVGLVVGGG